MSKRAQEFFNQIKKSDQQQGFAASLKEVVSPLKELAGQIWDAAKPMFDHGRTEAVAALFSGQGHVMYMRGQEGIAQGQDQALEAKPPEVQQEQSQGGMEM